MTGYGDQNRTHFGRVIVLFAEITTVVQLAIMSSIRLAMRPDVKHISDPQVWNLLMSPVRVEIAESLASLGPCSIREVAEFLDRPADTLYRHVALLEEAGLVVDAGFGRGRRNPERLIDLAADDFRPAFDPASGQNEQDAVLRTVETIFKTTQRLVRESAEQHPFRFADADRNIAIGWELGWLRPEDVREAHSLILQLKALMDRGKNSREGRPFVSLCVLSEVAHKRGASREPASSGSPANRSSESIDREASRGDG